MGKLDTGDLAPDFSLKDQNGKMVNLAHFKGRKLLVYFYPKALTSGCNIQAQEVSAALNTLAAVGVDAVGISPDTPAVQKKFDEKYVLNFQLLSDPDHLVSDRYGVWGEKTMYGKKFHGIIRSSFLIDEKGQIIQAWYKVSPKNTVPNALKELKK
jgi:thioredoxin-dependent peroxiredoxin